MTFVAVYSDFCDMYVRVKASLARKLADFCHGNSLEPARFAVHHSATTYKVLRSCTPYVVANNNQNPGQTKANPPPEQPNCIPVKLWSTVVRGALAARWPTNVFPWRLRLFLDTTLAHGKPNKTIVGLGLQTEPDGCLANAALFQETRSVSVLRRLMLVLQ